VRNDAEIPNAPAFMQCTKKVCSACVAGHRRRIRCFRALRRAAGGARADYAADCRDTDVTRRDARAGSRDSVSRCRDSASPSRDF
jgi:hypothetical protein